MSDQGRRGAKLTVMKAQIGTLDVLSEQGYLYEPKLDGYRALCFVNESIAFISRNGKDLTSQYPELTHFRENIKASRCVLDGEIVAYDEKGHPSFTLLQRRNTAQYVVFDILMKDGKSLLNKTLKERKKILAGTVEGGNRIEKIFFTDNGEALWQEATKLDIEGVVAKEINGRYYPGERSKTWLKLKIFKTIECVIVGFTQDTRMISSLALGLYKDGDLVYVGTVGTGFSDKLLHDLYLALGTIKIQQVPVINPPKSKDIQWVKPVLVIEIKYLEFTPYNILRGPVFLRLRFDKKPQECTFKDQVLS